MKRLLILLLVLLLSLSVLVSCTVPSNGNGDTGNDYTYTAFTASEKAKLTALIGEVIPFIPNNEYYFETILEGDEEFISFYTYGSTEEEYNAYLAMFDGYTLADTRTDENGGTAYYYAKGNISVRISYYLTSVDVFISLDDASDDNNGNGGNAGGNTSVKTNTAFTASEREALINLIGETVPYLSNDEYYFVTDSDENGTYINFYTVGNTQAEFDAYRASLVGYTLIGTDVDDYGDTWYCYSKGDIWIDVAYYLDAGEYVFDAYIYLYLGEGGSGGNEGGNQGGGTDDFTASEKSMFTSYIGEVIPFLPADTYYIDDYRGTYDACLNYYTYGNTQAQFELYRAKLSLAGYELSGTEVDDYGDTWYYYEKGDVYLDVAYYETDDGYVVDVYVYPASDAGNGDDDQEGNEGGNQGGTTYPDDSNVITNNGAGLPNDSDGVFDVDFTGATNVKDVTDQGYYLDGCPTTGFPAVLVIPVEFSDVTAKSKGYDIATLYSAFASNDPNDGFYSVYEYYNISSYGQLTIDFTILDNWFKPSKSSSYYASSTDSEGDLNGDQIIIDEALAYLSTIMDLSAFDSDGNGIIDAVVIVHTLDIDETKDFYWAYRYWNYYTDRNGYYYEYDGVSANDYLWASFAFLYESYDGNGDPFYTDKSVMNTYTFIHEFGHVLGADDYYDTSYSGDDSPLMGMDVMDGMFGDHNAFTKINYGWITTSRLVVTSGSVTLSLEAFAKNGDTIIIANNWDEGLGAYQEYYIIVYYTDDGLNTGDDAGYFLREGIVVYHVNASLYREVYEGEVYYDIYNNNTDPSDEYGTVNNLIEYVTSASGNYTYVVGDTMPDVYDDAGNRLAYNFVVDSIDGDIATITVTRG